MRIFADVIISAMRFFTRCIPLRMYIFLLLAAMALCGEAQNEAGRQRLSVRIDSALQVRYARVSYDTAFIARPPGRLTLKFKSNLYGNYYHSRIKEEGTTMRAELETATRATLSLNASYRGLSLGVSFNPASLKGKSKDYEFNLNIYKNRFGIDAFYQLSETLNGEISYDGSIFHLEKSSVKTRMLHITGYYVFNHRRFSYPAAFTQSFVQKRSAGSWLAGFSYQAGSMKTTDNASEHIPPARLYVGHFAIGGGYAYNLIAWRKWLFHLSAMPTLVVLNSNNVTVSGEKQKMPTHFPELILNNHAAVVYNISPRCFLSLTGVNNSTVFASKTHRTNQTKWQTHLSVGVRL